MRRVPIGAALLTPLLLWSGTVWAQTSTPAGFTPTAQMYELTETARLIAKGAATSEMSTSAMMGFAQVGSPLCPSTSPALAVAPGSAVTGTDDLRYSGQAVCVVTLTGSDTVDLWTGLGPIQGSFKVVAPDPANPRAVDAPELVVMKGSFTGTMDFAPALLSGLPYGTVTGQLTVDGGGTVQYTGVFDMPFAAATDPTYANPCNGIFPTGGGECYLTYALTALNPPVVQVTGVEPVTAAQKSLAYPMARFDIYFQQ